ncbi:gliding motility-associated C-terminal domain-containing protein [bacterium]|nr:gliding motility-associated C-terminal domain-containing protein [bacterium]
MENSSCLSLPSPFTPNGDGINDFCQFTFPDMMFSPAVIRIYDIHSVLVKDIQVPLGWAAKSAARWYGKDNSGKPVPQGVYLYEIEQNGEVICTGTVTVAR